MCKRERETVRYEKRTTWPVRAPIMVQWPIGKFMIRRYLTKKIRTIASQSHRGRSIDVSKPALGLFHNSRKGKVTVIAHLYRQLQRKGKVEQKKRAMRNRTQRLVSRGLCFSFPEIRQWTKRKTKSLNCLACQLQPEALREKSRNNSKQGHLLRPCATPLLLLSILTERHHTYLSLVLPVPRWV